ncbi:hypothetical protein, variant [Verruconis gallopava]|uniref:Fe2OG dioxygenase domain-containing protein n=1 Tax=Verruconis gallopava TaxID=253628 RepID=A0A0D2A4C7_9PEZI|nr:uncharacterized protein PV09_06825 [Verruconis gallopava]XP_016211508.1 hypothetical protein, variant [Verruconis gallopava]KIW01638.1 hypothetical protein PV09_06825 [Verruconis gallopava]KIW01639.1 hypothetical protein, variant [Verruconis gallopava]
MTEVLNPFQSSMLMALDNTTCQADLSTPSSFKTKMTVKEDFDASKHLIFEMPEVVMMEDIGYSKDVGISPVAVSKPFQLFSHDAVMQMRREVFDVRDNHPENMFQSNIAPCQLRGYVPKYAPFTYDAWTHPDTLAAISKVAGVDLVPWGDYEIAHINLSTKSTAQVQLELDELESKKRAHAEDEGIGGCPHEDEKPIVGWHKDSYPFVCVLMLSDCTNMIGGETAILKGNGEIERVRGPSMGCAVVLQGRYITHQALRALGATERITAVTSFRPRSSMLRDDTVLNTVRPISDLSTLYYEFSEYRLEMLVDRFQAQLKKLRTEHRAGKKTDVTQLLSFLNEQQNFIAHMTREIVPYNDVIKGLLPKEHVPDDAPSEDATPGGLSYLEGGTPSKRPRVD